MKGLDLAKFKKISEDDKSTTLKHPNGHTIVIALDGITAKMKEELKKLSKEPEMKKELKKLPSEPGYTAKKMAEGGAPEDAPEIQEEDIPSDTSVATQQAPTQDMDPNSPAPVEEDLDEEQPAASQPQVPAQLPAPSQAVPAQPQQQMGPPAPPAPPTPEQHGANIAQEIHAEDQGIKNDIAAGHIEPKTFASMFHDKSTLGKIGTIFGMLLSGAGSGLAHQPNALMGLMQQELDRDLEAQKTSASNAQNGYRLQQAHQKQQADIKQMDINNRLTQAQTALTEAKTPFEQERIQAEINQLKSQSKQNYADAAIKTDTLSQIVRNRGTLQYLTNIAQSSTSTPQQKADAEQKLGMMSSYLDAQHYDLGQMAGSKSSFINSTLMNGQQQQSQQQPQEAPPGSAGALGAISGQSSTQQGPETEPQFQKRMQLLKITGNEKEAEDQISKHMPGIIGKSSIPLTGEDRSQITDSQKLQSAIQRVKDFSNAWADPTKRAQHPIEWEKAKNSILPTIQDVKTNYQKKNFGGVSRDSEISIIDKIIPDPTKYIPNIRVNPQLDSLMNENRINNNISLKSKGFPDQQTQATQQPQQQSQPQYKTVNGVQYMRGPDGKAVKVK